MKDFGLKKLYYSISEVSKLTSLEQYILRYWETEFDQLKPQKNRAGNRIYTNKDIKLILFIKKLLRAEKYTIEGAKKILAENPSLELPSQTEIPAEKEKPQEKVHSEEQPQIQKDLLELKNFLLDLQSKL